MVSPNPDDPVHRLRVALTGFLGAWDRSNSLGLTPDPDELAVPLTEAMWWARNVDEWFEDEHGKIKSGTYGADRDADPFGRSLLACRFVRNRSHEHALTVEKPQGFKFPIVWPLVMGKVIWRPIGEFNPGKADPDAEAAYVERLQARPPSTTLKNVGTWIARALDRPGSNAQVHSGWWRTEVERRPLQPQ